MKRIIRFVFFISVLLVNHNVFAGDRMPKKEALAFFAQSVLAYKDARYEDAVKSNESIIEGGWESGPIYYNLANSYYKNSNLGKAILNYERALRLMPRDSDLRANLNYAQSLVKLPYQQPAKGFMQNLFDAHTGFYTLHEMDVLMFLIGMIFAAVHLLSLYLYWPKRQSNLILLFLGFLFAVFLLGSIVKNQQYKNLSIVLLDTSAKFEPRDEATTHFELFEGNKVKCLKKTGLWIKIQRLDGKIGWIPIDALESI